MGNVFLISLFSIIRCNYYESVNDLLNTICLYLAVLQVIDISMTMINFMKYKNFLHFMNGAF